MFKPSRYSGFRLLGRGGLLLFGTAGVWAQATTPSFNRNVAVHDPSVVRVGGTHYVFGSHLASARTTDLMGWTVGTGATLVADPATTFAEAIAWAGAANYWAPDVHRMDDGRYYYYYCITAGDSPRSALGIAVSNTVTGPYAHEAVLLKSGMWDQISPDGTIYNATRHPNAVDPCVFRDAAGAPWMVYGSYSGGIFILRLDPMTGRPVAGQGYGKKLIGGNHSRIEAPYILHHPGTGYYYLFLSFGGLDSTGGYQARAGRSLYPDGPYTDSAGGNLVNVRGPNGSFFDDAAIAPHGSKLIGNYRFLHVDGEPRTTSRGYLSPGHNSATYDAATGRAFMFFHTRFVGRGEQHEVRVHELWFNDAGWPVVAPHRFAGEASATFTAGQIPGRFKLINHGKDISTAVHESVLVALAADGTVSGEASGTWALTGGRYATLTLGGVVYRGVFARQWDDDNRVWVLAFSALSGGGVSVWGSKVAAPNAAPVIVAPANADAWRGELFTRAIQASDVDFGQTLSYSLSAAPAGASIDVTTGAVGWTPSLAQAGATHRFTVRVADNGADPRVAEASFDVTVHSRTVLRRIELDFTAAGAGGLRDGAGVFTGLTARLPGTGASVPANDPLLALETSGIGALAITSSQADYNGGAGLAINRSVGVALSSLGFTGAQDFVATAVFRTPPTLGAVDQIGLFVGASGSSLTRAGAILFGATPEGYATHTQAGADVAGRFGGGLNLADGLTVRIGREGGAWRHFVDGVEWNPQASGVKSEASFLGTGADLTAGVFAITPFNTNAKTVRLESFAVVVDTGRTPLEVWRAEQFAAGATEAEMADAADPDGDGLANLLEYALGWSPVAGGDAARPAAGVAEVGGGRRLTLGFTRVGDPALTYTVEAADAVGGPWREIWSSGGGMNTPGPVVVVDDEELDGAGARFLRLRVAR